MSERWEEDLMEDYGYDEAMGSEEMDDSEEFDDSADDVDLGAEEWEADEEEFIDEGFDDDGFDDYGEDEFGVDRALEDAMVYALGAEDTDEFFRRLWSGIQRVGGTIGRVARAAAPYARAAAPLASLIPGPWGQAAGTALGLLGRLQAEGASEEDALDAFAEYAAYDEQAMPILAGLAARNIARGRCGRIPKQARRAMVRGMAAAARTLAQRRGPAAVRAIPRIVRSVRRTAAARRTPVRAIPRIAARTAANVARSGRLFRRLVAPIASPGAGIARRVMRGVPMAGLPGRPSPRAIRLRGPVRISINSRA